MKVLKWVAGVPVGLFALLVVWKLIFVGQRDPLQNTLSDCRSNAAAFMTSDPARAVSMNAQCDALDASLNRPNQTKVYGPNGQEK